MGPLVQGHTSADCTLRAGNGVCPRFHHGSTVSFLLSSPATGPVQAEPRSHCGRGEEALHVFAPECQGGAGSLPLQRPRGAQAHGEWGDLGLQQGRSASRGSCEPCSFLSARLSVHLGCRCGSSAASGTTDASPVSMNPGSVRLNRAGRPAFWWQVVQALLFQW